MEVTVQTQRDNDSIINTLYTGEIGGTPDLETLRELALEYWPFVVDNWDDLKERVETHYIKNGLGFYALDLDDEGYNVHTIVKFVH